MRGVVAYSRGSQVARLAGAKHELEGRLDLSGAHGEAKQVKALQERNEHTNEHTQRCRPGDLCLSLPLLSG
jgi:hypothetical protein